MIAHQKETKRALAQTLGISRASLYYASKQLPKDWSLKTRIETVLSAHTSYGYRRVADELHINRKRVQRAMRLFGLRAYRRRGRKPRKKSVSALFFPNLLKEVIPAQPGEVWISDFTYIPYQEKFLYLATVMDIVTREVVGYTLMSTHTVSLVLQAFFSALLHHPRPQIYHSDNGSEYCSKIFISAVQECGVRISRSAKASPWENGYQESFYSQFKVDLGDPNRFKTVGELAYEIHHLIWEYNHTRIHSAFRMPPKLFAEQYQKLLEKVS